MRSDFIVNILFKVLLPKTDDEKRKIWENALFVADANILLNLYKYSDSTRSEFIKVMEKLRNKLWIPHQVALEFLHNRANKIQEQEKEYKSHIDAVKKAKDASKNEISKISNTIKKSFRKIDIDELLVRIDKFYDEIIEEIEDVNKGNPDFNQNDIVLEQFLYFYKAKIGESFTEKELEEIYKEGVTRYEQKIPPGYRDLEDKQGKTKKYGETVIKSEYGDLILWKQVINKSKEDRIPIVFISDDTKEDWRESEKGKKGPRKELLNEFVTLTEQEFLMYTTDSFLRDAKEFLNMDVNESTMAEVHSVVSSFDGQPQAEDVGVPYRFSDAEIKNKIRYHIEEQRHEKKLYDEYFRKMNEVTEKQNLLTSLEKKKNQYLLQQKQTHDEARLKIISIEITAIELEIKILKMEIISKQEVMRNMLKELLDSE